MSNIIQILTFFTLLFLKNIYYNTLEGMNRMGKSFDTIDIVFISIISIYLLALIIFITIFLMKYFEKEEIQTEKIDIKEEKDIKPTSPTTNKKKTSNTITKKKSNNKKETKKKTNKKVKKK